MVQAKDIKYRKELKYVCSERELRLIEARIQNICRQDVHAGDDGVYSIRSVYFDDYDNTCFYENENGTDPREKFRIRIYDGSLKRITLECKRKEHGLNHKFSCPLTEEQLKNILAGEFPVEALNSSSLTTEERALLSKFYLKFQMQYFRAKVIVEYERTAYIYDTGNVRITFDRNISGSSRVEEFTEPVISARPVMPIGTHVLEVKYDELLPDYIYNALQIKNLRQTAYSKYYICRKLHL